MVCIRFFGHNKEKTKGRNTHVNFKKLKNREEQRKQARQLGMILRNDYIGTTAYDKIASIMQIKARNAFWNSQEDNIKKNIINWFKTLYKHNCQVNNQTKNIIQTMLNTLNILKQHMLFVC